MTNASWTLGELCGVACAEAFRDDGEVLASGMGTVPMIGTRLARATFAPDLLVTDGEAYVIGNPMPVGPGQHHKQVEGWMPFRSVFDTLWSGRRHVMMGASQIDRFGNQNIACIGSWAKPKAQLLGVRGAPGNTVNHRTSYWIPNHTPRVFVEGVDVVSGVGYDRGAVDLHRVITNKAVLDFESPDHSMRLRSVHPGVSVDEVVEATGFSLVIPDDVEETRPPTDEELELIRTVLDPDGLAHAEVKP